MKIKYYLRGLATGIVVAAVLMALSMSGKQSLSDEEIKERAAKLGMVMSGGNTLASGEKVGEQTESAADAAEKQESKADGDRKESEEVKESGAGIETAESEAPGDREEAEGEERSGESENPADTEITNDGGADREPGESVENRDNAESGDDAENGEPDDEEARTVTVVIRSGYGSVDVARELKKAGLVENAEEFDDFLCEYGYDKYLCVDVYRIPVGSSYEQIAKIITKKTH